MLMVANIPQENFNEIKKKKNLHIPYFSKESSSIFIPGY